MGIRRAGTQGGHRARNQQSSGGRRRAKAAVTAVGMAGVAVAGAAMLGTAPTMSVSPQLLASLHYLRGTTNGHQATQQEFEDFIGVVVDGTGAPEADDPYKKVDYNAGFWPISAGGFKDLKFDESVAEGVANLAEASPANGDVIFGFSQGRPSRRSTRRPTRATPTSWSRIRTGPTAASWSASRDCTFRSSTSASTERPLTTAIPPSTSPASTTAGPISRRICGIHWRSPTRSRGWLWCTATPSSS